MTTEERLARWKAIVEASHGETVTLFWNRKLFRAVKRMFETNRPLQECGGHAFHWIANMYARDAAMLVRRELDKQRGVLNLRHLLHDIEDHHADLLAQREARHCPSQSEVRADREELVRQTQPVREYAERLLAHRTPAADVDVTWADLDVAVRGILKTMRKYYALVTRADLLFATPVAQYDWLAPFCMPWTTRAFEEPENDEEL